MAGKQAGTHKARRDAQLDRQVTRTEVGAITIWSPNGVPVGPGCTLRSPTDVQGRRGGRDRSRGTGYCALK